MNVVVVFLFFTKKSKHTHVPKAWLDSTLKNTIQNMTKTTDPYNDLPIEKRA